MTIDLQKLITDHFHDQDEVANLLQTYLYLPHTSYWLWAAIERIACGEDELEVLEDYGYLRDGLLATKYHQVKRT
jgi:hypothetical protein